MIQKYEVAIKDLGAALKQIDLVTLLGWQDVKQRYRRSKLGPLWLTISTGVLICTIGLVFGQIFSVPMEKYLPFLTLGLIIWNFIIATITDGCNGFIAADHIIKQLPLPLSMHILRIMWRNIIILLHNLVIFPLVLLVIGKGPNFGFLMLALMGFFILVLSLTWMTLLLATVCSRFRDFPQIVISLFQVVFYLTPIIWLPSAIPDKRKIEFLEFNPFFHLIEIVRAPLLGNYPTHSNWVVGITIVLVGWLFSLAVYGAYKKRIAFWL